MFKENFGLKPTKNLIQILPTYTHTYKYIPTLRKNTHHTSQRIDLKTNSNIFLCNTTTSSTLLFICLYCNWKVNVLLLII